ncbi:hypothetical protein [Streptomyces kanamyceticus]|uniref:Uncharacterized protein n=1 Tax=Streptomyces kanamyceticus TaxID=1967 RepID=A0A5J6GRH4_STRKN|nr:hypothetical protein [Streptomyces kanamyceticus]QEU97022.1 hypothetical protein CP970_01665 [Streptomyces kanamyceticus]
MAQRERKARGSGSDETTEQQVKQLREIFADAPQLAKRALENVLEELKSQMSQTPSVAGSAGRVGSRQGTVSELTIVVPFAPGGAERLRALLRLGHGDFAEAERVGTVHDMRFVFLDNDTKLLFATAYDGEWDAYIDDFATKVPDYLDMLFSAGEGWPGIKNPAVKDWIAEHQVTAEGWYVANPDLTVVETRRLERVGEALDEFLDRISD